VEPLANHTQRVIMIACDFMKSIDLHMMARIKSGARPE
jgi:hypothetical protein